MLYLLFSITTVFANNSLLETYGDSITAGFLAQYSIGAPLCLEEAEKAISDIAIYRITGNPDHLRPYIRRDLAWPTYLGQKWNTQVSNYAVPGHLSENLIDQIKPSKGLGTKSIVFIGHNDLCGTSIETEELTSYFSANIQAALIEWDKTHESSTMYLIPIAQIWKVYQTLSNVTWLKNNQDQYTCEDSWRKFFPYCPSHLQLFKQGKLQQSLKPRTESLNQALERIAEKMNLTSKNRYHYLSDMEELPLKKEYFSIDCFHLSKEGQLELTKEIWKRISAREEKRPTASPLAIAPSLGHCEKAKQAKKASSSIL